jgi:branched-subunit amino acid permease
MPAVAVPHESGSAEVLATLRDRVIAGVVVALALFVLYVVFFDQGALLSPALGETSRQANYLHEFAHDGRHLFAAQCH